MARGQVGFLFVELQLNYIWQRWVSQAADRTVSGALLVLVAGPDAALMLSDGFSNRTRVIELPVRCQWHTAAFTAADTFVSLDRPTA